MFDRIAELCSFKLFAEHKPRLIVTPLDEREREREEKIFPTVRKSNRGLILGKKIKGKFFFLGKNVETPTLFHKIIT